MKLNLSIYSTVIHCNIVWRFRIGRCWCDERLRCFSYKYWLYCNSYHIKYTSKINLSIINFVKRRCNIVSSASYVYAQLNNHVIRPLAYCPRLISLWRRWCGRLFQTVGAAERKLRLSNLSVFVEGTIRSLSSHKTWSVLFLLTFGLIMGGGLVPLRINGNALVTFPEYDRATWWQKQDKFSTNQMANMVAQNRK